MYGNIIIIVNTILLILILIVTLVVYNKGLKSMFNYTYMLTPLLLYIFPIIISVINSIINFKYGVKMIFWVIGLAPMCVPLISIVYGFKLQKNNEDINLKYSDVIKFSIINYMQELNITIGENDINLFFNKDNRIIYCKVIIKLNVNISDKKIIEFKSIIENLLNEEYKRFKYEVFIDKLIVG